MLRQLGTTLSVHTKGRGLHEITGDVQGWVAASGFDDGLLTLFVRHTSASLLIQENADPDVRADLDRFFARLVPDGDALFRHQDEGPDDMPAHVRAALTAVQLSIPLQRGQLVLGTWQGLCVWEHRARPHQREVARWRCTCWVSSHGPPAARRAGARCGPVKNCWQRSPTN